MKIDIMPSNTSVVEVLSAKVDHSIAALLLTLRVSAGPPTDLELERVISSADLESETCRCLLLFGNSRRSLFSLRILQCQSHYY